VSEGLSLVGRRVRMWQTPLVAANQRSLNTRVLWSLFELREGQLSAQERMYQRLWKRGAELRQKEVDSIIK